MDSRTFVIGDIHGCYQTLVALLGAIDPDPGNDTLLFLGDYIDRGPHSNQVVEEILGLRKKYRRLITLKGNHEHMLLCYLAGKEIDFYLSAGGQETLQSYGAIPPLDDPSQLRLPKEHYFFFQELLNYWEDGNYIYVHAGLQPGIHLTQQNLAWLLWARENFINLKSNFGKKVIYGHTPFTVPKVDENKIGIDTGAVYGGGLTCLILPEERLVTVPTCDEV